MKGKLMIGAALLLCLALVAVAPAVAWGGAGGEGSGGNQAAWQINAQGNVSAGDCPCAEDGTCHPIRGQSRDGTCTGVCDAACDRTQTRQRICRA